MKPTDVFRAILKAIGVMFWAHSLEELPGVICYSPFFYKVETSIAGLADTFSVNW